MCRKLINQEKTLNFIPHQELLEATRLCLDSYVLSQITGSDMKNLSLGALNYGNKAIRKKILSRVVDANRFSDLMVELSVGAWHLGMGHDVVPIEETGLPDLKVNFSGFDYPAFIECKHLTTTTKRRLTDVIRKANIQIKKVGHPCYGIVFIDATIPISAGIVHDDRSPKAVLDYVKTLSVLNSNKYKSVGAVIISWDDNMIFSSPANKHALIVFRRRFVRLNHSNANTLVPISLPIFSGYVIEFFVTQPSFKENPT